MKITNEQKELIVAELKERLNTFESQAQAAKALGISSSQMTRVLKGELNRVLSDESFLRLANNLEVDLKGAGWKTAETFTFKKINTQLRACQDQGISAMLVDDAGIGKTHAAKHYAKRNRNAVYVDCSQVKTKSLLIKEIARKFGLNVSGRYADMYRALIHYINSTVDPLIILDEAGDLKYDAFLELKALWNATEHYCGFYMMGADGLRAKINRNIIGQKVGYTEIFRRFGERFQQVKPDGLEDQNEYKMKEFAAVAHANRMTDIKRLYAKSNGSLTRLKIEYLKAKRA